MNKPYFAVYLPVEGEIKEGDYWLHPDGTVIKAMGDVHYLTAKKVKLFLCCRDIQVGEKYTTYLNYIGNGEGCERVCFSRKDGALYYQEDSTDPVNLSIKIIGEISPDALWVKEGDEFDEEQWRWWELVFEFSPAKNIPFDDYATYGEHKLLTVVQIEGQCGHFH